MLRMSLILLEIKNTFKWHKNLKNNYKKYLQLFWMMKTKLIFV